MAVDLNTVKHSPNEVPLGEIVHFEDYTKDRVITPNDRTVVPPERSVIERRLRRKYDFRILLPTILIWLMAYIDRSNVGNALILGMAHDIDLTSDQLSIALSAFFVVYIVCEIPSNILCNKVGPRIWLSGLCFGFGLITMCTAFTTSYHVLVTLRVLLAVFEAGLQPGILTAYARFYRRHELVGREGIKASMAALAGSFGGLLATGLSHIPRSGPLYTWRWIFLIEGIITMAVAVMAYIMLADDPSTARFLTSEEREIGADRVAIEVLTRERGHADWPSFQKAILNINTQVIGLCLICALISMTSLTVFMPTLLKSLMGYSSTEAQLMSVPPYAFAAAVLVVAATFSDRKKTRGPVLLMITPLTVIGFALMGFAGSVAVKYVGLFFSTTGAFTASSILIAWVVDNSAGPAVRAIAVAYAGGMGNIGALIATWCYQKEDGPTFLSGNCINLGMASLLTILVPVLSLYLRWENKQRDSGKRDHRLENKSAEEARKLGHKSPEFRFTT